VNLRDEFFVFSSPSIARDGERPWAGAERPKDGTSDPIPQEKDASSVYIIPSSKSLGLKLRQQALKLGLVPGSARWRAYVLGTQTAAARRRREKEEKAKAKNR
jgi:hypothetical protein